MPPRIADRQCWSNSTANRFHLPDRGPVARAVPLKLREGQQARGHDGSRCAPALIPAAPATRFLGVPARAPVARHVIEQQAAFRAGALPDPRWVAISDLRHTETCKPSARWHSSSDRRRRLPRSVRPARAKPASPNCQYRLPQRWPVRNGTEASSATRASGRFSSRCGRSLWYRPSARWRIGSGNSARVILVPDLPDAVGIAQPTPINPQNPTPPNDQNDTLLNPFSRFRKSELRSEALWASWTTAASDRRRASAR